MAEGSGRAGCPRGSRAATAGASTGAVVDASAGAGSDAAFAADFGAFPSEPVEFGAPPSGADTSAGGTAASAFEAFGDASTTRSPDSSDFANFGEPTTAGGAFLYRFISAIALIAIYAGLLTL